MSPFARRLVVAVLVLAGLAGPAAAAADAKKPAKNGKPVTVMTRNIYLGGDIGRPIAATEGLTGLPALIAFGQANHTLFGIVQQTDFPARAKLLAKEIATRKPDLIGLQEVALWRTGPLELGAVGVANATDVHQDFLAILRDELRAHRQRYEVVDVQAESDVEGPSFETAPGDPTSKDVRLTMRDVILKRAARDVKIEDSGGGQYTARIDLDVGGAPFSFIRGYNWADVRAGSKRFRFVNTHLESASPLIRLLQAQELLAGPANAPGRSSVVVCDCNSDPLDASTNPADPVPTAESAAYDLITGAGGFHDTWLQFAPASEGFTFGFSETLDDPDASGVDHRIDMVFAKTADGSPLRVDRGWTVGDDPDNRTSGGLWPSDHLGVVMRLRP